MNSKILNHVLFFLMMGLFSCNPDCDSLTGLRLSTQLNPSGQQLMVTATPPSSLEGRRIFFNNKEAVSVFVEGEGLVVTVPEGIAGKVDLRIEDPDCLDFIALDFDVVDESFFQDNPTYIFPPTPEIIIPNLPVDFPPSIENAWLHPVHTDYCFWLKLLQDDSGNCTKFIDTQKSSEKSICEHQNVLYASNPLSGWINPDGSAFVVVHRPGGEEEFTGRLVNPLDVPAKYRNWKAMECPDVLDSNTWGNEIKNRDFMMLLTSRSSGRQLLIYQQNIPGIPIDCQ